MMDRVELISTEDPWTRIVPGTQGTIIGVDDLGTVHVRWDDGHVLGLVPGVDRWRVLEVEGEVQACPEHDVVVGPNGPLPPGPPLT